jgi:hypothetical protein
MSTTLTYTWTTLTLPGRVKTHRSGARAAVTARRVFL